MAMRASTPDPERHPEGTGSRRPADRRPTTVLPQEMPQAAWDPTWGSRGRRHFSPSPRESPIMLFPGEQHGASSRKSSRARTPVDKLLSIRGQGGDQAPLSPRKLPPAGACGGAGWVRLMPGGACSQAGIGEDPVKTVGVKRGTSPLHLHSSVGANAQFNSGPRESPGRGVRRRPSAQHHLESSVTLGQEPEGLTPRSATYYDGQGARNVAIPRQMQTGSEPQNAEVQIQVDWKLQPRIFASPLRSSTPQTAKKNESAGIAETGSPRGRLQNGWGAPQPQKGRWSLRAVQAVSRSPSPFAVEGPGLPAKDSSRLESPSTPDRDDRKKISHGTTSAHSIHSEESAQNLTDGHSIMFGKATLTRKGRESPAARSAMARHSVPLWSTEGSHGSGFGLSRVESVSNRRYQHAPGEISSDRASRNRMKAAAARDAADLETSCAERSESEIRVAVEECLSSHVASMTSLPEASMLQRSGTKTVRRSSSTPRLQLGTGLSGAATPRSGARTPRNGSETPRRRGATGQPAVQRQHSETVLAPGSRPSKGGTTASGLDASSNSASLRNRSASICRDGVGSRGVSADSAAADGEKEWVGIGRAESSPGRLPRGADARDISVELQQSCRERITSLYDEVGRSRAVIKHETECLKAEAGVERRAGGSSGSSTTIGAPSVGSDRTDVAVDADSPALKCPQI